LIIVQKEPPCQGPSLSGGPLKEKRWKKRKLASTAVKGKRGEILDPGGNIGWGRWVSTSSAIDEGEKKKKKGGGGGPGYFTVIVLRGTEYIKISRKGGEKEKKRRKTTKLCFVLFGRGRGGKKKEGSSAITAR